MNEIMFSFWLTNRGISKKVASDIVSRLKKVERDLDYCDLDEEYEKDRCKYVLNMFLNLGDNLKKIYSDKFPIGKKYITTYRHAIKKYVLFKDLTSNG